MSCGAGNYASNRIDRVIYPRLTALEEAVKRLSSLISGPCPHGISGVRCDLCYAEGLLGRAENVRLTIPQSDTPGTEIE